MQQDINVHYKNSSEIYKPPHFRIITYSFPLSYNYLQKSTLTSVTTLRGTTKNLNASIPIGAQVNFHASSFDSNDSFSDARTESTYPPSPHTHRDSYKRESMTRVALVKIAKPICTPGARRPPLETSARSIAITAFEDPCISGSNRATITQ